MGNDITGSTELEQQAREIVDSPRFARFSQLHPRDAAILENGIRSSESKLVTAIRSFENMLAVAGA